MKTLNSNDFVICNKEITEMFCFADTNEVVIYGNKEEAILDLDDDEIIVSCVELPINLQNIILKQLN